MSKRQSKPPWLSPVNWGIKKITEMQIIQSENSIQTKNMLLQVVRTKTVLKWSDISWVGIKPLPCVLFLCSLTFQSETYSKRRNTLNQVFFRKECCKINLERAHFPAIHLFLFIFLIFLSFLLNPTNVSFPLFHSLRPDHVGSGINHEENILYVAVVLRELNCICTPVFHT